MPASIALPEELTGEPAMVCPTARARFTLDGSNKLEHNLALVCKKILKEIQDVLPRRKFAALLLGGGYGRGEGGVLKTASGDRPYNDLEFYVFVRGNNWLNEQRFDQKLRRLAHELTPEAGVEVEFKIISTTKLRRSPASIFYYDLVVGHRKLLGDENLLVGCEHHRDAKNIPLSEATRLLMNRCSGLLFAREKLEQAVFTTVEADYVCRNLAKAQLACGDAVLTAYGQYHWSCLKRHERLRLMSAAQFPWPGALQQHHNAGVKFKLHPHRTPLSRDTLQAQHDNIVAFVLKVWLWLESRRLGLHFTSARNYALNPLDKCPGTNPWRNRLVNAKGFGASAFFSKRGSRHPRERILNALALLLWEPAKLDAKMKLWLREELRRPVNAGTDSVKAFQEIWRQFG
ncbi:MAG TPA: hypothetical protein VGI63_06190 [Verrucomicrobiae bacterium]|jgi:hypothetical protein